jgi:hypothetical protein
MNFSAKARFAFSILDDTDDATLENVAPVYEHLKDCGFRTTKTVWPLDCPEGSRLFFAGQTLQDKPYLEFVHRLAEDGFELAYHGATMESSRRERSLRGIEFLQKEFGVFPRLSCNHGFNRDNLYWGHKRFQTAPFRQLAKLLEKRSTDHYSGDRDGSDYFWGDAARQHVRYVRNFTFHRLNMLTVNPEMPYRLKGTPYVQYWFSTTDAPDVDAFNRVLSKNLIDELEQEGGVRIISTHLGKGFVKDGKLNGTTRDILHYLSQKAGWFVPVSEILDYLLGHHSAAGKQLGWLQTFRLESRFLLDKVLNRIAG